MRIRTVFRDHNLQYLDFLLIAVSVVGSYLLRLEFNHFFRDYLPNALFMLLVAWLIKPFVYRYFGLYKRVWAYASTPELKLIAKAVSTASILVFALSLSIRSIPLFGAVPRSVYVIDWLFSMLAVGSVRLALRLLAESQVLPARSASGSRQVLIVGAGDAGALVVRELQKNPQANLSPTAFLDDDPEKQNRQIHGVPVVGMLQDLAAELETRRFDEVIVSIPSAPGSVVRDVAEVCRMRDVPFRTMPGIYELIGGVVSVSRLREVNITDLLRREPVYIDNTRVGLSLRGKRVLITGAGGSIASELCRQIARWAPTDLTLVGHGENSIFDIMLELEENFPSLPLHALIADVRDMGRIQMIFETRRPEVIFHAAAHKHVHLMELNVEEAVTNNIMGTLNVVNAALANEINHLVMVSTDKAVRPTSVMGATKRIAEMVIQDSAHRSGRAYSVVRFGNVLDSRGSVVPLFKRQIAHGGPVNVRHPDVERYFMTIPEAVHLILQASSMGQNGEMFVLDMGQPVRILDLAEDLIKLSGLEPGEDIEIEFTGMRPGEKLTEELWDAGADYQPTDHPDINRLDDEPILNGNALKQTVDELIRLAQEGDAGAIVQMLDEIVPGAKISSTPPPDLRSVV